MSKVRAVSAALAMALLAVLGSGSAAAAAPGTDTGASASVTSRSVADPTCEKIQASEIAKGNKPATDKCEATETVSVSARVRLTPEAAVAMGDPLTPSGLRLSEAAALSAVYYQNWTQERRGLYYVNWYEKHQGPYYFDGTYAWVTPRWGWDAHGYHQCDLGYGVLYDVQVKECSVRGNMTGTVIARDTFRVHVVWSGIPLYTTHTMDANLPKSGL